MKEFGVVKEAASHEGQALLRGLVLLGSALGGAGLALAVGVPWPAGSPLVIGPQALGAPAAAERLNALLALAAAALGLGCGHWLWLRLAHLQTLVSALPPGTAVKRAAVPFAVFLPQATLMLLGRPSLFPPLALFAALQGGFLLLALLERTDKRKIFFAHPTQAEYQPGALFTHGGVMVLGAGLGAYLCSLPAWTGPAGAWVVLGAGAALWLASLLAAAALNLVFSKPTFDQVYAGLALVLLPLALLPLQAAGWLAYADAARPAGGFRMDFLPWVLASASAAGMVAVAVVVGLHLRRSAPETQPAWDDLFRALMLIAGLPPLLFAAAYWPAGGLLGAGSVAGAVDPLRDGEALAAAQGLRLGRLPFEEILFRHGFLADAFSGVAATAWFGLSAESLRLLQAWLVPLGLVGVYYLSIFCLPWSWALAAVAAVLGAGLGAIPYTRFFFPLVGFIFTLLYLQRGRWPILIFSGLATALALLASYTAGVLALTGHVVLLAGFGLFGDEEHKRRWTGMGVYLTALAVGLLPWFLYLALSGSLGAFFGNFSWVLTQTTAAFGQPLPAAAGAARPGGTFSFLLPPIALLAGLLLAAKSAGSFKQRGLPWNVLLLWVLTLLLWWRFLARGEWSFLEEALPVAVLLLAFYLFRLSAHHARLKGAIFLLLVLGLLLPRAGGPAAWELLDGFGNKNRVPAEGLTTAGVERLGALRLPPDQARNLEALAAYLDRNVGTADAYYDFSDQPLLYFLVPRPPVVRALSAGFLVTFEQQGRAIRSLQNEQLRLAVWPGQGAPGLDGIPAEIRQWAVAEYLLSAFTPIALVGGQVILAPQAKDLKPDPGAVEAMRRPLELGALPAAWGELTKYDASQGGGAGTWTPETKAVEAKGLTVTAEGGSLTVAPGPGPVRVTLSGPGLAPASANAMVVTLAADPALDGASAELAWPGAEKAPLTFRLRADGRARAYAFRLGAVPAWVQAGETSRATLTMPAGGFTCGPARLLRVADLPGFAQPVPDTVPASGGSR